MSRLPIGQLFQSDQSLLFGPRCLVLTVCPVPAVQSLLSCSSCSAQTSLSRALLMRLSCPGNPVLSVMSRLAHPGRPVRLTCPHWPVFQFQLPCPGHIGHCSPDTTVISWQSCHPRPFHAHLSRLPVVPAYHDCPVLDVLSQLSCSMVLSQMSYLNCHGCSIRVALS